MPELSRENPLEHSQLKLPGVLTQEAREPQPLFGAAHSLLSEGEETRFSHSSVRAVEPCAPASGLPIQAVWCCVNPVGHLQVKPPMVLTQWNWQLCCFVEHSSTSEDGSTISGEASRWACAHTCQ